jgi:hypothetical protein
VERALTPTSLFPTQLRACLSHLPYPENGVYARNGGGGDSLDEGPGSTASVASSCGETTRETQASRTTYYNSQVHGHSNLLF